RLARAPSPAGGRVVRRLPRRIPAARTRHGRTGHTLGVDRSAPRTPARMDEGADRAGGTAPRRTPPCNEHRSDVRKAVARSRYRPHSAEEAGGDRWRWLREVGCAV